MKDKLNITIRIANQPPIALTINRDEEEIIRQAEANVNRLWLNWSERFNTSPTSLLAMVAFQFAKLHAILSSDQKKSLEALKQLDTQLDELLDSSAESDGSSADAVKRD